MKIACLEYLDRAAAFYRHCKDGLEALPLFEPVIVGMTHFGLPATLKQLDPAMYPGVAVPVLPWGWWVKAAQC